MLGMLSAIIYTVSICYESGGSTFRTWSLVGRASGDVRGDCQGGCRNESDCDRSGENWRVDSGRRDCGCYSGDAEPICLVAVSSAGCDADVERLCAACNVLDIFLVWLSKLLVLSFGGISLYRRVKPCCYGLIVGYVFAVGCSF